MSDSTEYGLLLPFDRNEPEFSHGFECGRIWAVLADWEGEHEFEVHKVNAEMMVRIAEATERQVTLNDLDGTWTTASFTERGVAYQEDRP